MSDEKSLTRSPELMSVGDSGLLVVDAQQRLIPAIANNRRVVRNARRLVDGANLLGVPAIATEQYPQGLGATVDELAPLLGEIPPKLTFSCLGCPEIFQKLADQGIHKLLVCGIEAHVCVQQTVLDLLAEGWRVYVAADAVGSRHDIDYQTALRRMDSAGATLTTTEAALFEWLQTAESPQFKKVSRLIQEEEPA